MAHSVTATAPTRRLAAILVADVVGYSRLMEADEAGTLAVLKERRKTILGPVVEKHGGRVVKVMGDGVLIEFASAVKAVEAALALQEKFTAANEGVEESRRIVLRIGINLGDVVGESSDIYGDGVNIAARLEPLAAPGSICISAKVHDEVRGKITATFLDIGEQQLKNIASPVRAFSIGTPSPAATRPLPGKASIAVLPFANMSGDPEQEYFADGITEDLITELSRFHHLFVIARNSCFTYKGKPVKIETVRRELGVDFVVEGSVRKAGPRIRVTAQLIESSTGGHLWAERYDRDLTDIFAVQDELVKAIAGAIPGEVSRQALEQVRRKPPENLTAYECELRGRWAYYHLAEGPAAAFAWYERAIKADPNYALALAGLARCHVVSVVIDGSPREEQFAEARVLIAKATSIDSRNPIIQTHAAIVYSFIGENDLARQHADRAVALNPNDPFALDAKALTLTYGGNTKDALEWYAKSEKLEPFSPDDHRLDCLCDTYYMARLYEKVVDIHRTWQNVPANMLLILAAAYAQLGRLDEAKQALSSYQQRRSPQHSAAAMIEAQCLMCARPEDREHWLEGYRKAGIEV